MVWELPWKHPRKIVNDYFQYFHRIFTIFTIDRGATRWGLKLGLLYCPWLNGLDLNSSALLAWKKYPCVEAFVGVVEDVATVAEVE